MTAKRRAGGFPFAAERLVREASRPPPRDHRSFAKVPQPSCDRCVEGIHVHMHDFARPLAAFVVCHGLASIRTICIAQTWEVRAAFVTLRRLYGLAAHRHAPADHSEGHASAKRFHQQLALKRAVAMTWAQMNSTIGFRRFFSFGARSFIGCRGRMRKIPIPAIDLNPLAEFSDGHCRSTSARHMRIDSCSL